jgi:hypothetical protein
MKNYFIYAFLSLFALFAVSCSTKTEDVLPKKNGKWNVSGHVKIVTTQNGSSSTQEIDRSGTVTFTDTELTFSDNSVYTWSVAGDKITIVKKSDNSSSTYTITESSAKSQKWHEDFTISQTIGGIKQSIQVIDDLNLAR